MKKAQEKKSRDKYSVEFFHIYTDERIANQHIKSLEYLRAVQDVWEVDCDTTVLIDNYNPVEHTLLPQDVISYLDQKGAKPDYWAYEADMVFFADRLLDSITSVKVKKEYLRYIEKNNKYPCSLLTTVWYLCRLGVIQNPHMMLTDQNADFVPADRLINILPSDYRTIEMKVHKLLNNSSYKYYSSKIQALFYDAKTDRKINLF